MVKKQPAEVIGSGASSTGKTGSPTWIVKEIENSSAHTIGCMMYVYMYYEKKEEKKKRR
jgi:hypothetical protein